MAGKLVTEGYEDILTWYLKNVQTSRSTDALYLGLYTDTTEPTISATLGSGLTELALSGYARIQLLDADWTVSGDTGTNLAKTFTAGEDWGDVYGSFICNSSAGGTNIISVKHFTNGPFNVLNTVEITPIYVISS